MVRLGGYCFDISDIQFQDLLFFFNSNFIYLKFIEITKCFYDLCKCKLIELTIFKV